MTTSKITLNITVNAPTVESTMDGYVFVDRQVSLKAKEA